MNYNISVTGDCQSTSSGAISLFINGGNEPYTVQWVTPNLGTDVVTSQPSIRTSLDSDTYIVTVNDSTLPVNQTLNINIPVSSGVCATILGVQGTTCGLDNGSVTGTSSSNFSTTQFYLYDSNDNNLMLQSTNINVNEVVFGTLSAGTYYMKVIDVGGCTGYSQNFIIEDSTPLDFGLYVVPNSSCGGTPIGKITITGITGSPPYTYNWSNGATGNTITGLTSGPYSVTVTDSFGCSQTKGANVTDVPQVALGAFTAVPPSCFQADGSLTIQIVGGTAPYYYSASTGEVTIQYGTSWTVNGLSPGFYSIQVTDAALCSFVAGTVLTSPQGMTSVSINTNGSTCSSSDGSIQVSVIGGVTPYTYTIIYPNGNTSNISSSQTTYIFNNLSSGTYSIAIQDSSSCYFMEEVTLFATNTYTISTNVTGTTCNQNNGSVLVTRTEGGASPYDFSLDGVQNVLNTTLSAVTFTNVSSGQHTVSVTDAAGCVQTSQVYVGTSDPLDFTLYSTSCGNGTEGTLTALISSGTPPFTFNWSTNVPGNPQEIEVGNLSADTYTLSITDSNGCTLERSTTITCDALYVSYQTYVMGGENFTIQSQSKFGLTQMLNEGFNDLTANEVNCHLNNAVFGVKVSVNPSGFTTSENFFTGTTLTSAPPDSLYYETLTSLLLTVPGIGGVIIDDQNNQITINTIPGNNTLNGQRIVVELTIVYDILCECQITPTPTPTPTNTGTPTPTPTPTNTRTPTPTPTLTPTPTSIPTSILCSVFINTSSNDVYQYQYQTNTTTLLNPDFNTTLPAAVDIAHTPNKMWLYDGGISGGLYEYNITLSPFSGSSSRSYYIPGLGPGLFAKNDTTLISSSGNTIGEVTLFRGVATFTPKFNLPTNREITGDIILTTNNKLITSNIDSFTFVEYITQQDYTTGAVEFDISWIGMIDVFGLFIDSGNIYFTLATGDVYSIDNVSPYTITYQTNNGLVNYGASQIPSCCNVSFT